MSFNLNEETTYINIKLTDAGRRSLALGNLKFKKLVLLDREIDYNIDRSGNYDILHNRILSPCDAHPEADTVNLDGSDAIELSSPFVTTGKLFATAGTLTYGFFTGTPNNWTITSQSKGTQTIAYGSQLWGESKLVYGGTTPADNDLVMVCWAPPQYSTTAIPSSYPAIPATGPILSLFYRVISGSSGTMAVDRPIPNFGNVTHNAKTEFYSFNAIEDYYGSGQTQNTNMWNLNITRTTSLAGTDDSAFPVSGYTRYGSLNYAGTKLYFGFKSETPALGFIHYTNQFTGDTFGEQLLEKTVEVHIPLIMWHHYYPNGEVANGQADNFGLSLYDIYGDTHYDTLTRTTYRELRDGLGASNMVVGRVYHKLKLIVITDQELLTALSYKSNRNYTYPEPIVSLSTTPASSVTTLSTSGLCQSGYTYFVSMLYEASAYTSSNSFGYPPALHCGYIKKIQGENDINGNPKYLKISFPSYSFPYMRNDAGIASFGNGWNANNVQILVSAQPNAYNYDVSTVPPTSWKRVSTIAAGGNGVLRAIDLGTSTIDPATLNAYSFIISAQDYSSGTTYVINSGLTSEQNYLNFGSESFFYGTIKSQIMNSTHKGIISAVAYPNELNISKNPTFSEWQDQATYVTEIAVLNDLNQVVAVGKPTYPLKKEPHTVLAVQLQIDF